jgi:hypothetical protein
MSQKEIIIQEAVLKFTDAVSIIEAVDLYTQLLYKEALAIADGNSEKYQMAMLKFQNVKRVYKQLVKEQKSMVEAE